MLPHGSPELDGLSPSAVEEAIEVARDVHDGFVRTLEHVKCFASLYCNCGFPVDTRALREFTASPSFIITVYLAQLEKPSGL